MATPFTFAEPAQVILAVAFLISALGTAAARIIVAMRWGPARTKGLHRRAVTKRPSALLKSLKTGDNCP